MADAQDDSQPAGDEIQLAPENIEPAPQLASGGPPVAAKAAPSDMTVAEMRQWLRNWIANATGQSPYAIND